MDNFKLALRNVLKHEGGYANNPADRGGETFRGISRRSWPGWIGWAAIDQAKANGLFAAQAINDYFQNDQEMEADVAEFYRQNFWLPLQALAAPARVKHKLFNAGVNIGLGRAVCLVQEIFNERHFGLIVDGLIGPKTAAASKIFFCLAGGESYFLARFINLLTAHYVRLAQKPGQAQFLKGWLKRAEWLP